MKNRLFTAFFLIALLVLAFFSREVCTYIFDLFVLCVSVIGAYEFSRMLSKIDFYNSKIAALAYPIASYIGFAICLIVKTPIWLMVLFQFGIVALDFVVVFLASLIFKKITLNEMIVRKIRTSHVNFCFKKACYSLFCALYPTVLLFMLITINHFGEFGIYTGEYKSQISLFALIVAFAIPICTDTFAMLCGSLFKGKKMCPSISPNKTISGAIGGVVFGVLIPLCLYLVMDATNYFSVAFNDLNIQLWHIIILTFVSSLLCQLGDLFESYMKRKAQVKDSGNVFPGHGGILDRFDSHLFCYIPILCYLLFLI